MYFIADLGNTQLKYALYKNGVLLEHHTIAKYDKFDVAKLIREKEVKRSIVSSVVNHSPSLINVLKEKTNFLEFNSETSTPLINLYKTTHTLGNDRLASAVGAYSQFPKKNILVIDSGTCLKYNFITSNGEYIGGGISPGIEMRLKALNYYTDRLPQLEADFNFDQLIGTTSKESILSGVMNGSLFEVEGMINKYEEQYDSLQIVITGGSYSFFENRLKKSIFADPLLILKGLNKILEYNIHDGK